MHLPRSCVMVCSASVPISSQSTRGGGKVAFSFGFRASQCSNVALDLASNENEVHRDGFVRAAGYF